MRLILMFIVAIAALNIISGLIMLVKNKGRDVAILRTMGASQGAIMRIFFVSGSSIGVAGTLVGVPLGVLFCTYHRADPALPGVGDPYPAVLARRLLPEPDPGEDGAGGGGRASWSSRSSARAWPRWRRPGGPRASIRWRRFAMSEPPVLSIRGLERAYVTGERTLPVLKGVDLDVRAGEVVGLIGPSGSGKSSLLHAAGLLEHPNAGRIVMGGVDCSKLSERERTRVRLAELGFVYQFHHLLPEFTALDNVALPIRIAGASQAEARRRAEELLVASGPGRAAQPPAGPAFGRRAAARRHRPGAGQPAAPGAGRRAHRQSRSRDLQDGVRGAARPRATARAWRRWSPPTTWS